MALEIANDINIIHSGHFMVSCLHDDDDVELPVSVEVTNNENKSETTGKRGYNFDSATLQLSNTYLFGNRSTTMLSLDPSLTKMFECMTLAYSGKLVSPKWKNFRGIKVKLTDKIRLNNIIWREWHMQFRQKKNPIICQFETPVSDRTHAKPEAIVMEGKYWKRRLQCVTNEYFKWRKFFKEHFLNGKTIEMASHADMLDTAISHSGRSHFMNDIDLSTIESNMMFEDDFGMDFSDTLFTSLNNQPLMFPDPKEISQFGFADFIQPGLIQLQPNLDDFMDTIGDQLIFKAPLNPVCIPSNPVCAPSTSTQADLMINLPDDVITFLEENLNGSRNPTRQAVGNVMNYTYGAQRNSSISSALPHETKSFPYRMETGDQDRGDRTGLDDAQWSSKNSVYHSNHYIMQALPRHHADFTQRCTPSESSSASMSSGNTGNLEYSHTILKRLLAHGDTVQKAPAVSRKSSKFEAQQKPKVNEFHKNMLIAAASQAIGFPQENSQAASTLFCEIIDSTNDVHQVFNSDVNKVGSLKLESYKNPNSSANQSLSNESKTRCVDQPKSVHQSAEYKRRCNIKSSFEMLNRLVPSLCEAIAGKINKATTLTKTADFCCRLRKENEHSLKEIDRLSTEIDCLQADISCYQAQLPASGAPVARSAPMSGHMASLYENYVRSHTLANWKFWIFSLIIQTLYTSYSSSVINATSPEELNQRVLAWLERNCSLVSLRPVVLGCLRNLSTTTSILTDPTVVPQQAAEAVRK